MMAEAPTLLVPATTVPVAPEIRGVLWYDHKMPNADLDQAIAARAHVVLARLIRLDRMYQVVIELVKESSRIT